MLVDRPEKIVISLLFLARQLKKISEELKKCTRLKQNTPLEGMNELHNCFSPYQYPNMFLCTGLIKKKNEQ